MRAFFIGWLLPRLTATLIALEGLTYLDRTCASFQPASLGIVATGGHRSAINSWVTICAGPVYCVSRKVESHQRFVFEHHCIIAGVAKRWAGPSARKLARHRRHCALYRRYTVTPCDVQTLKASTPLRSTYGEQAKTPLISLCHHVYVGNHNVLLSSSSLVNDDCTSRNSESFPQHRVRHLISLPILSLIFHLSRACPRHLTSR